MTVLFWVVLAMPAPKVDSALRSLPFLHPLRWIEVWFLAAAVLGMAACASRRRWWIAAPCLALATAAFFFVRVLG
jgi:hypothetical protein